MDNIKEKYPEIYDYILLEEADFRVRKIPLGSNWDWNFSEHINQSFLLKNSKFTKGKNDYSRPFKNIIIPIANVNYRTEGFDVKDIEVYVDDPSQYHLSLLTRKYHSQWAIHWSIDTAIDDSVESYFDYGVTLVKDINEQRPEVIELQTLAFCDQTDILSGPICIKHQYSVDQLLEMKGKWYKSEIDKAILMAEFSKTLDQSDQQQKTPGKYIEVYELHGMFPESWLGKEKLGEAWEDTGKYSKQLHIVTYYVDTTDKVKKGICLFKGKETKEIFKVLKRDKVHGRAAGRGGIEELFDPTIWINYSEIQMKELLDAATTMIMKTTDKKFAAANKLSDIKKLGLVGLEPGTDLTQVSITPQNFQLFTQFSDRFIQSGRTTGSASDPSLGLNPSSGTPLGTTEIVTAQGEDTHKYRQGKIALFWGEIYRDWTLQHIADEMAKGDQWLEELTVDELKEVADKLAINESNKAVVNAILSGKKVTKQDQDALIEIIRAEFMKGGKKRFMKAMKDELKGIPLKVKFNIAGKQKNLAEIVNKLNGVFRSIFANPAILQAPGMSELFNNILEYSGLSPINFAGITAPQPQPMPQGGGMPVKSPVQPQDLAISNQT